MDKIFEILKNIRPECDFERSGDFINNGYLDSFDVVTLVSELDREFDISIDGLDIIPENFANASSIKKLIIKNGGKL
jgi:acyl carrier protein